MILNKCGAAVMKKYRRLPAGMRVRGRQQQSPYLILDQRGLATKGLQLQVQAEPKRTGIAVPSEFEESLAGHSLRVMLGSVSYKMGLACLY